MWQGMWKEVTEVYWSASLITGSTDLCQPMHSSGTTAAPCSSSHKTVLGKLLPPLLCLWAHCYLSWKLRVTRFAHTWRCNKSVLNAACCIRQGVGVDVAWELARLGHLGKAAWLNRLLEKTAKSSHWESSDSAHGVG